MHDGKKLEPDEFREAIGLLAAESMRQKEVIEAQGELLRAMNARIKTMVALVDGHQAAIELLQTGRGGIVQ